MTDARDTDSPEGPSCTNCGRWLATDWLDCPACGAPVAASPLSPLDAASKPPSTKSVLLVIAALVGAVIVALVLWPATKQPQQTTSAPSLPTTTVALPTDPQGRIQALVSQAVGASNVRDVKVESNGGSDYTATVTVEGSEGLTGGLTKSGLTMTAAGVDKAIFHDSGINVSDAFVYVNLTGPDSYGQVTDSMARSTHMDSTTAARVNWADMSSVDFGALFSGTP